MLAKVLTRGVPARRHAVDVPRRAWGRPVDAEHLDARRGSSCYLQTHDQVGNRMAGDRISAPARAGRAGRGRRALPARPITPMLFMGEEWGASTPVAVLHQLRRRGARRRGRGGAAGPSSAGTAGPRTPCPTRRTPRPATARCSTGPRPPWASTRGCCSGTRVHRPAPRPARHRADPPRRRHRDARRGGPLARDDARPGRAPALRGHGQPRRHHPGRPARSGRCRAAPGLGPRRHRGARRRRADAGWLAVVLHLA